MELRIKDIVELKNIKTDDHAKPYIGLENIGSWNSRFIPTESVSEGINNEYSKDDILFGKLRPYLAKAYIAPNSGVCSTEFFVLHTKKGYYNKYLLYRLLTPVFIGYISSKVAGVKMPRTTWADFSSISFDIPSLSIQQRIVSYLDNKTAKIDRDVSLLQKKRDAYTRLKSSIINRAVTRGINPNVKLKDSGVEWIGMMPEGWDLIPLKGNIKLMKGRTPSELIFEKEDLPYLTMDYLRGRSDKSVMYPINSDGLIPINSNEVLVLWDGANAGEFMLSKKGYLSSTMAMIYVNERKYSKNYFFYLLKSIELTSKYFANGTTIPHFSPDIFYGRCYPCPPLSEQQAIASYLDTHCSRIDHAISIVDKQIDAYTRLKKSLINEVVTGKRKV